MSLGLDAQQDHRGFIVANTRRLQPPLVPEITLYLAEESVPLWQKTEEQLGQINVPPPFWAFAWAGGQALARYILDTPDLASGKRVIDLGAGSGLCAIAARFAGAATVVAADVDPFCEFAIALNAEANDCQVTATTDNLLIQPPPAVDLVLIGDLFYEQDLSHSVLAWADAAMEQGARVLVGDPRRSFFPAERFRPIGEYAVPVTRALEDAAIKRTAVWELMAR